jgi:hypothetical protein
MTAVQATISASQPHLAFLPSTQNAHNTDDIQDSIDRWECGKVTKVMS